jgi:hypothetical protein
MSKSLIQNTVKIPDKQQTQNTDTKQLFVLFVERLELATLVRRFELLT